MSENFCPACGSELEIYVHGLLGELAGCTSSKCWFRCNRENISCLAAAMKLARTEYAAMTATTRDETNKALNERNDARKKILEVFK